jgi:addiction module HigA family antidote
MYNPPHPGEFIMATYLEACNITGRYLASKLGVAPSKLNRVLKDKVEFHLKWRLGYPRLSEDHQKVG